MSNLSNVPGRSSDTHSFWPELQQTEKGIENVPLDVGSWITELPIASLDGQADDNGADDSEGLLGGRSVAYTSLVEGDASIDDDAADTSSEDNDDDDDVDNNDDNNHAYSQLAEDAVPAHTLISSSPPLLPPPKTDDDVAADDVACPPTATTSRWPSVPPLSPAQIETIKAALAPLQLKPPSKSAETIADNLLQRISQARQSQKNVSN